MAHPSSNSLILRMFAISSIWIAGCVGRSAVEQSNTTGESSLAEPRTGPQVIEQQTRTFRVSVDGTERGVMTMLLSKHSDDTETMRGQAELSFNFVAVVIRFVGEFDQPSGLPNFSAGRRVAVLVNDEVEAQFCLPVHGLGAVTLLGEQHRHLAPFDAIDRDTKCPCLLLNSLRLRASLDLRPFARDV